MAGEIVRARVRSADGAARTALVELYGSEGVAVPALLADSVHPSYAAGPECLVAITDAGERVVVATLEHDPAKAPNESVWADQGARLINTLAFATGSPWTDLISTTLAVPGAARLVLSGFLMLRTSAAASANVFVNVRGLVAEGALASAAISASSALASTRIVVPYWFRIAVPGAGAYTTKVQIANKISGSTITIDAQYLQVEARL